MSADLKRVMKSGLILPLLWGSYVAGARRMDLWPILAYVAFTFTGGAAAMWLMKTRMPGLLEERTQRHAGTKRWDIPLVLWIVLLGPMGACFTAGADARVNGIAAEAWSVAGGYLLGVAGVALTFYAMTANRFFSGVVRIQTERGHAVADGGPYAFVRHPGYVGMLLTNIGTPLMLASRWAWIPVAVTVGVILLRTALEDATLRRELPGYAEFTQRTRSRLIPGLW